MTVESMEQIIELEQKYGAHNYNPLPVVLTRGQGVYVWDTAGKRYIDMMGAYSAISHGHCHPRLVRTLSEQAHKLAVISRAYYSDKLGLFFNKACELFGFDKALAMNSGAEAVETAIKACRKWAYTIKKVPIDQVEIIVCEGNFHGRTTTAVGLSTEKQYRSCFGPFAPGFRVVPYGDAEALERAITPNTAAFLLEPIQGEAGIRVPPEGYLKRCYEICQASKVLLIADEIQTGLGRTGKLLACDHEGIKPDGVTLGKALGGGLLPVSLFLAKEELMSVFTPGDHGSTFGGNLLAAAVGLEALNVLVEENLVEQSAKLGQYFLTGLKKIDSPLIREVRGRGLFLGVEINTNKISGRAACLKLLELGLLTKETHETTLRFAPPLVIQKNQIDEALSILQEFFI